MSVTRSDIVREARAWIDTPWHHRACELGIGVDCIRLIEAIAKFAGTIPADFVTPDYRPNPDSALLIRMCDRHLVPTTREAMAPADVVVVRIKDERRPRHVGILADYRHGGLSIIHACNARSCRPPRVIETRLMFSEAMQFVAAYRFPGV